MKVGQRQAQRQRLINQPLREKNIEFWRQCLQYLDAQQQGVSDSLLAGFFADNYVILAQRAPRIQTSEYRYLPLCGED